jgi:hypothetical protein
MAPMPAYEAAAELSVKGVVEVLNTPDCPGGRVGVHPILRSAGAQVEIHLGPQPFLAKEKFALAVGDSIEVIGSKVKYQGREVILARQVSKGDRTLKLRDMSGKPVWSMPMGRRSMRPMRPGRTGQ